MTKNLSRRNLIQKAGAGLAVTAAGVAGATMLPARAGAIAGKSSSVVMRSAATLSGPLSASMQEVVTALQMAHALPLETLSPENARQLPTARDAVEAVLAMRNGPHIVEAVGGVKHITIPGPDGALLARVYTPFGTGPFPILVYFHGGGWVVANLDTYDSSCRALTNAARFIVVSVAYRQAPEHPFPAAAEDAYASLQWVIANATSLGGIATAVTVGGESAGGNLAAVASLITRDRHGAMPMHQLLVYPITNYAFDTVSYQQNATAPFLSRAAMMYFWKQYLSKEEDGQNPYASPQRATDLSKLPPATVISAQDEVLWSEGEAYAERLRNAGVYTTYSRYAGVTHEFFSMSAALPEARKAVTEAANGLRSVAVAGEG